MSDAAKKKARAAEALYKEGELSANESAQNLGISKATLYKYLRYRGVRVGLYRKHHAKPKVIKVALRLRVERNNTAVRGKKRAREDIEQGMLRRYQTEKFKADGSEYVLTIPYQADAELDQIISTDTLHPAARIAEGRNCFTEADVRLLEQPERHW